MQTHTLIVPNHRLIGAVKSAIDEGKSATILLRGYSMRPFLEDKRDQAILSPVRPENIRTGDVILAMTNLGSYVIHRVESIDAAADKIVLRGDGNVYGREWCRREDVVARVTGFLRGKQARPCSLDSKAWKIHSRIWPSSPLWRRILLKLHRTVFIHIIPIVAHGRVNSMNR